MTDIQYTNDGKLTDNAEYGRHVLLTCIHHPTLRWSTKNIAPLGCRRIFFDGSEENPHAVECDCPPSALKLV